ncbi:S-layer homology domain-containing protein [Sporobacter termitidis DSM 10068]|uniref:S-layer homology domain-containing protein n=1 Tax=Sporobacter termitidis DSM 10068 TaxID=1123282 RepID=A0A1M5WV80_9FIRM|nr:S-layer homology domain-containing protein [Sporobacter termitidis]SHH91469.1 S-layer homology domain-containing protein [Sporobacter termitidis DSM 10068]
MKRRIISVILVFVFTFCLVPKAYAAGFPDVPADSWAGADISKAVELGVMTGYDSGLFGYGDKVTRAQFTVMLTRLFHWDLVSPDKPTFTDNADTTAWYYSNIETAVKNGAVAADSAAFRPNDNITREEMAIMLVRGLGYTTLAGSLKNISLPFTDVTNNKTFIAMAYEFGIINGTTTTTFTPSGSASREEAAAMMVRLNDRFYSKLDWTHAFYAISSYAQRDLIPDLSAVSFGWSRMEVDANGAAVLNTTSAGGNSYSIPQGYQEVVQLAQGNGVKDNLDVYMTAAQKVTLPDGTATDACTAVLTDPARRAQAIAQIVAELRRENNYAGVTIDFEEMRGDALKTGLNQFLQELKAQTDSLGASIYVCVQPVMSDGQYYNAYDYKTIGTYADKVILMAHDYAANSLTAAEMGAAFTTTPVSPIYEVYTALQAITDSATGVADKSKIALAVSFNSVQWKLTDGKIINQTAYKPDPAAIYSRMLDPTALLNYSDKYQNPYITYHNATDNTDNITWYEDTRSVDAKMALAKMFGVTGVSIWRLGIVPAYADTADRQIYFDIPSWLAAQK